MKSKEQMFEETTEVFGDADGDKIQRGIETVRLVIDTLDLTYNERMAVLTSHVVVNIAERVETHGVDKDFLVHKFRKGMSNLFDVADQFEL